MEKALQQGHTQKNIEIKDEKIVCIRLQQKKLKTYKIGRDGRKPLFWLFFAFSVKTESRDFIFQHTQ